jgi:hypothetical protein
VATAVGAYELEIITGPGTEKGERARLNLFSELGRRDRLGRIYFYGPQVTLKNDFVDRGTTLCCTCIRRCSRACWIS